MRVIPLRTELNSDHRRDPAGWYPDPAKPDTLRWWDGHRPRVREHGPASDTDLARVFGCSSDSLSGSRPSRPLRLPRPDGAHRTSRAAPAPLGLFHWACCTGIVRSCRLGSTSSAARSSTTHRHRNCADVRRYCHVGDRPCQSPSRIWWSRRCSSNRRRSRRTDGRISA